MAGQAERSLRMSSVGLDFLGALWSYYASYVVLGITVPLLVLLVWRFTWPSLGQPLSSWVAKRRRNPTAEETRRLTAVRKVLSTLAHDVLKHRLLGLVSLVQSLDVLERETSPGTEAQAVQVRGHRTTPPGRRPPGVDKTQPEQWEGLRSELLRLCGARAAPHDRLWARWTEAFAEVRRIGGSGVLPPWADAAFRPTDKTLRRLRRMVRGFVAGEREAALGPGRLRGLGLPELHGVHGEVLRIVDGCRPEVRPQLVVREALSALGALVGRKGAQRRVQVSIDAPECVLASAPGRLLAKGLERLLDNALRLSGEGQPIGVRVEVEHDEMLGDEVLVLRVLDALPEVPSAERFGTGLRSLERELTELESGLTFQRCEVGPELAAALGVPAEQLVKEARITVPISSHVPMRPGRRAWLPVVSWLVGLLLLVGLGVVATSRVLGGAPVQFAGGGEPVVEFRVEVGDELRFTLCEGGRGPRAEVRLEQDSCRAPFCSLAGVVEELKACDSGLGAADCPGEFAWTPRFKDGSRQGTSYELSVACRADGPPRSDDTRRIRLVVSRPNSPPRFVLFQLTDNKTETLLPLAPGREVEIPAGGDLTLQALARDDDDDFMLFQLAAPGSERPMESYDGRFDLGQLAWATDGSWVGVVTVSDGVAPATQQEIRFKAGQLRPIRLETLTLRNDATGEQVQCVGPSDARLCEVADDQSYVAEFSVWFDPLLRRVDERVVLSTSEESSVRVVPRTKGRSATSPPIGPQVGQRWDVMGRYLDRDRVLATIDLFELPSDSAAGSRSYRFRVDVGELEATDPQHWTLKLSVHEVTGRTEPLDAVLVLARSEFGKRPAIEVSQRLVKLSEYETEADRIRGRASLQVFLFEEDVATELAQPTIVCESPALAAMFERPRLRRVGPGAWLLQLQLQPGCIDGLGGPTSTYGAVLDRTCRVDLGTADGRERTAVRVRLEDRPCAPVITQVEANVSRPVREGEEVSWQVDLTDPDGDLDEVGVSVKGGSGFRADLRADPEALGSHLYGTVSGVASCRDLRGPLSLEVRDRHGFVTRQAIPLTIECRPLVHTVDGQTDFVVDEGDELIVPLESDPGVRLSLKRGDGVVEDGQFAWTATCDGDLDRVVEIRGEHEEEYGEPLRLTVHVRRCALRLYLEEKGKRLEMAEPLLVEAFTVRRIRIVPERASPHELAIGVALEPAGDELSVSLLTGQQDIFDLRCRRADEQRDLVVTATPVEEANERYLSASPLRLPVQCVPRGTLGVQDGGLP